MIEILEEKLKNTSKEYETSLEEQRKLLSSKNSDKEKRIVELSK